MATACVWTITLLYIYLYVWGLDLRLNNINYSYWYYSSSIIITSLYWTSETPLSLSITTSEYLICDKVSLSGKYIPIVILLSQHLLYKPTFLTTHPCGGDATIQVFHLLWQGYSYLTQSSIVESYSCQCLNTETSAWGNRSHTTKTLNISYIIFLYKTSSYTVIYQSDNWQR